MPFLTSHCHKRPFPPASRQLPLSLYRKSWLLPCGTQLHTVVLVETGSPTYPSQPGPSPVFIQNQQFHRGCHFHCPPLTHLEYNNTYIRMLFVDFTSVFNIISCMNLIGKLITLGLSTTLCNWILDFLTHRPQRIRIWGYTSSTPVINTAVCSAPVCSHCTPSTAIPDMERALFWSKTKELIMDFRKKEEKTYTPV